jgi:hypothetical protein
LRATRSWVILRLNIAARIGLVFLALLDGRDSCAFREIAAGYTWQDTQGTGEREHGEEVSRAQLRRGPAPADHGQASGTSSDARAHAGDGGRGRGRSGKRDACRGERDTERIGERDDRSADCGEAGYREPAARPSAPATSPAPRGAQASRAARAQAVQRARTVHLISAENYSYVINDLKLTGILAAAMFFVILVLHFIIG